MIQNDLELKGTQERIAFFAKIVAEMRVRVPAENYAAMASGYLAEIEKMHAEVMEYLRRHSSELAPAKAA
jgi:hypothetical protein